MGKRGMILPRKEFLRRDESVFGETSHGFWVTVKDRVTSLFQI